MLFSRFTRAHPDPPTESKDEFKKEPQAELLDIGCESVPERLAHTRVLLAAALTGFVEGQDIWVFYDGVYRSTWRALTARPISGANVTRARRRRCAHGSGIRWRHTTLDLINSSEMREFEVCISNHIDRPSTGLVIRGETNTRMGGFLHARYGRPAVPRPRRFDYPLTCLTALRRSSKSDLARYYP